LGGVGARWLVRERSGKRSETVQAGPQRSHGW